MRLEPPEKVSEEQLTIDVREIEPLLQGPAMDLKPWPEAMITLKDRSNFIYPRSKARRSTDDDVDI